MRKVNYTVIEEYRKFILSNGVCAMYCSVGKKHLITIRGITQPTSFRITDRDDIIFDAHRIARLRCVREPCNEVYICTILVSKMENITVVCSKFGKKTTEMKVYIDGSCIYEGIEEIPFNRLDKLQETAVLRYWKFIEERVRRGR